MAIRVVRSREEMRAALSGTRPGLVPTMGALHEGHRALIARSVAENPRTVVSIFVNPAQFNDPGDLARYPRDFSADVAIAEAAGAGIVFAPEVDDVYPPGFGTTVSVGYLGEPWEGAHRPGHFRGVATVVAILLDLVRPARSYFGEKDYQQLQVIRRMHADLALPGIVVASPTVRDADGLALSSRNVRLTPDARATARALPRALSVVTAAVAAGETDSDLAQRIGISLLDSPAIAVDYFAIVDGTTLEPIPQVVPGSRLLAAIEVGGVRLIDNAALAPPHSAAAAEVES